MKDRLSIVIADDHPIFREGLRRLLETERCFRVVGEAGDGERAADMILRLKPDVAVLDISMPGKNGLEIVEACKQAESEAMFVVLTMYKDEEYFDRAMDLGVRGYILKENASADLLRCLKAVAEGRYYVSSIISDYLLRRSERKAAFRESRPGLSALTPMERRVLKLIAINKTSKEIAKDLFISYRTVQNHRANICQKLGLKGHNKLLQFALENKANL